MKHPKVTRVIPVVVLVVVAIVVAIILRNRERGGPLRVSGVVEATEARLGFEVAGRIAAVHVREGDRVEAGQILAHLDTTEAAARLAQSRAQLSAAEALLRELESGSRSEEIAQARAASAAAENRLRQARLDRDRAQLLFDGGAVSRDVLDRAVNALAVAQAQAIEIDERLKAVERGPRAERIEAQRAEVARARASLEAAAANLRYTTARAPFPGVVTVRHREPGETVAPGSPAVTIMNPDDRWVRIYVPETRIGRVSLGEGASITSDSYPDKSYRGEVVFIASEAEFTPKNVQTAEERVKLVYAVKVRVADDAAMELKPGMPADVALEGGATP
jgi:HlyD family secretion protein